MGENYYAWLSLEDEIFTCPECGSAVSNTELHETWHASVQPKDTQEEG